MRNGRESGTKVPQSQYWSGAWLCEDISISKNSIRGAHPGSSIKLSNILDKIWPWYETPLKSMGVLFAELPELICAHTRYYLVVRVFRERGRVSVSALMTAVASSGRSPLGENIVVLKLDSGRGGAPFIICSP